MLGGAEEPPFLAFPCKEILATYCSSCSTSISSLFIPFTTFADIADSIAEGLVDPEMLHIIN